MQDGNGLVVFRLGEELYGMPLEAVRELGRVPLVTPIPGAEGYVVGVCNLRGNIVALIDLRGLFGVPGAEEGVTSAGQRMLVLAHDGLVAGLLVDGVEGVFDIEGQELEPPLAGMAEGLRPWLAGQVRSGDRVIAVLDPGVLPALRGRLEGVSA